MPRALAAVAFLVIAVVVAAQPPSGALDKVIYLDRKSGKTASMEGVLKESPAGISVTVSGQVRLQLTPAEIVRVDLGELPGLSTDEKGSLFGYDSEKDPAKATAGYGALAKKGGNERVKRNLEFRELIAATKAAELKDDAGFKTEAPKVADRLAAFARANVKSWEVWPTSRIAARLYADLNQPEKASETLNALANITELPAELRIEARFTEADLLLRSSDPTRGKAAVTALAANKDLPAAGPQRDKLKLFELWANAPPAAAGAKPDAQLAKLQSAIDATGDPGVRAFGFNVKGELLLAAGFPRDAMWEFLQVDVVYNTDRDEVIKSTRRLIEIFDKVGDRERADMYRDKLRKSR